MKVAISNQAKGKSVQRLAISRLIIRQCEVDFQSLESLEVNCFNSRLPQKQTKKNWTFGLYLDFSNVLLIALRLLGLSPVRWS